VRSAYAGTRKSLIDSQDTIDRAGRYPHNLFAYWVNIEKYEPIGEEKWGGNMGVGGETVLERKL
jgi:hypothetical protein